MRQKESSRLKSVGHRLWKALKDVLPDALIIVFSYVIVSSVRGAFPTSEYAEEFFVFIVFTLIFSLYAFGVYHRIWHRTSGHGISVIFNAVLAASLVIVVVNVTVLSVNLLPISVILMGNTLSLVGFIAVRYRSRLISGLKWRWRAIWDREFPVKMMRVLIIGAGQAGQTLTWQMKYRWEGSKNYKIVGFVDDDPQKQGKFVENCPILGTREDIPQLVKKHGVEMIALAIHNISGQDFRDILNYCEMTSARIKILPDMQALMDSNRHSSMLRDVQPEDFLGRKPVGRHDAVDFTPIRGKVILVTGAAGSIGSEICRQLVSYDPEKVIMLDNNESGLHNLMVEMGAESNKNLVPVLADVTNPEIMERVFRTFRPQVVFHAAAYKHVYMLELYPEQAVRVNIGGTRLVAGLARDYSAERFVLISTDKAVNPTSVMGMTKCICEYLVKSMSGQVSPHSEKAPTLFTSVRFGNVLGSRGSVVPTFTRQIDQGGPVTVTDPEMSRYFMSIPEAVNLVIHAACLTNGGDLFMLRMGEEVRIMELAKRMIRMRGLRPHIDIPIRIIGARPGEKLHEELKSEDEIELPTMHPAIVQLIKRQDSEFPSQHLTDELKTILKNGLHQADDMEWIVKMSWILYQSYQNGKIPLSV